MDTLIIIGVIIVVCSWVFAYEMGKKDAINYMDVSSKLIDKLYGKDGKDKKDDNYR